MKIKVVYKAENSAIVEAENIREFMRNIDYGNEDYLYLRNSGLRLNASEIIRVEELEEEKS